MAMYVSEKKQPQTKKWVFAAKLIVFDELALNFPTLLADKKGQGDQIGRIFVLGWLSINLWAAFLITRVAKVFGYFFTCK
jgi:hypothetical protein